MLVFGRQIRSRLDLLLPKNNIPNKPEIAVRQFREEKVGKLRYTIRLDDGRIWERHIDHIAGVGSNLRGRQLETSNEEELAESNEQPHSHPTTVTPATTRISSEDTGGTTTTTRMVPVADPLYTPSTVPIKSTNTNIVPNVRRSTRVSRPPNRLTF
ncbi:uncharacterized protein LOC121597106 [Anopheles merus]|uniref:uncharacterized protein LOC121597106 n=1 Tax=Anopheles merus TaxID=30066 RepID=UPI001BE4135D|nr:uncharacterized protein LOC121597106 [Anopheles merus]